MKKILTTVIGLLFILVLTIYPRNYKPIDLSKSSEQLRIMTYNLKNSYQDYDAWVIRREAIVQQILDAQPDSLGIQEADEVWMAYLKEKLPMYTFVGTGRDGIDQGEHNAILFLTDEFELLEENTFWLSETPETVSYGWDAACRRIASYAKLKHLSSNRIFYQYNTHLDHKGKEARINGAQLILDAIQKHPDSIILTGDFNTLQGSKVYKSILKILNDSKKAAHDSMFFGSINYFTKLHFKWLPPIDFLFSSSDLNIMKYQVLYDRKIDGLPLSDHFPIFIDIEL